MKLGILGGSFNPIHLGHIFLADKVLSTLKLDRIIFIPAYCSPFKLEENESRQMQDNAYDRLDMLAASITGNNKFTIDDCEVTREGISYTVNTLEDIISRFLPQGKLTLIIGDDLAAEFPQWHQSDKILQLADIVIARRINATAGSYPYPHTIIDNDVMNISSQEVRRRIQERSSWRSLVPSGAAALIEDRCLYGYQSDSLHNNLSGYDCTQTVIHRIEATVRASLSTERFLHSRNTALHASDLCRRFGLDPAAGYLAGIAHDMAKQFDNKHLTKIIKNAGMKISILEKDKPSLLHGKAAAVLLRERFSVHNKDVLEAVAYHTSGSENMGALAKIVYIADKTESSRRIEPALRELCMAKTLAGSTQADLDEILFAVLEKTIFKLKAKKLVLSEDTLNLLNKMMQTKL
ncbi:MAG: nicotinate (nicotinamide) nucleotide adenylyltransferase [Treponema sp.]|jgi:nicotinate-nucleotide adenylyltransferase|nr:nicotinate (nicotinamide) nucleotide adenylyltransferase [Treponema sp.]